MLQMNRSRPRLLQSLWQVFTPQVFCIGLSMRQSVYVYVTCVKQMCIKRHPQRTCLVALSLPNFGPAVLKPLATAAAAREFETQRLWGSKKLLLAGSGTCCASAKQESRHPILPILVEVTRSTPKAHIARKNQTLDVKRQTLNGDVGLHGTADHKQNQLRPGSGAFRVWFFLDVG